MTDDILRREHFVEGVLGDTGGGLSDQRDRVVRFATCNFIKWLGSRINDVFSDWMIVNRIDFLVVSDAGLMENEQRTVWSATRRGSSEPSVSMVATRRAAVVFETQRWQSWCKKEATRYSPSGRSISLVFRLGGHY